MQDEAIELPDGVESGFSIIEPCQNLRNVKCTNEDPDVAITGRCEASQAGRGIYHPGSASARRHQ